MRSFKNYLIHISFGFIVLSPFAMILSADILKLPFTFTELFFLPYVYYFKKRINTQFNYFVFFKGFVLVLLLLLIALLYGEFRFSSLISTARGYAILLISFSFFYNKKLSPENFNDIILICIGSLIGWLFLSLQIIYNTINATLTEKDTPVYGNMIAITVSITSAYFFKNKKYFYSTLIILILLSLTSGLRRQIAVFFVSLVFSYLLMFFRNVSSVKKVISVFVWLLIGITVIINALPYAENQISEISPVLHYRIFEKSNSLFEGDLSEGDLLRKQYIYNFFENYETYLLPKGLVSKRTVEDHVGYFMDAPFLEYFHTFGIIFGVILILIFIYFNLNQVYNYFFCRYLESGTTLIYSTIFVLLMITEGSFLNYSFTTPMTGYILARIFSSKKYLLK